MTKLPNLDPEYEKATERLNRFFSEEFEDIRELSVEDLLWYLGTTLLWKELDNELIANLQESLPNTALVSPRELTEEEYEFPRTFTDARGGNPRIPFP